MPRRKWRASGRADARRKAPSRPILRRLAITVYAAAHPFARAREHGRGRGTNTSIRDPNFISPIRARPRAVARLDAAHDPPREHARRPGGHDH